MIGLEEVAREHRILAQEHETLSEQIYLLEDYIIKLRWDIDQLHLELGRPPKYELRHSYTEFSAADLTELTTETRPHDC